MHTEKATGFTLVELVVGATILAVEKMVHV